MSVVVPCFAQARYLQECVASLQAQSIADWEALVIDDGSPDHCEQVASALARDDPRVRYIPQGNAGVSTARNVGLRHARGTWVQFLDADDCLPPRRFELLLAHAAGQSPDATDALFTTAWYFDDGARERRRHTLCPDQPPDDWVRRLALSQVPLIDQLLVQNSFPECSPLLRRDALRRVGEFHPDFRTLEDWQYWLCCAAAGVRFRFVDLPEAAPLIRVHPASVTHDRRSMDDGQLRLWDYCQHVLDDRRARRRTAANLGYVVSQMPIRRQWQLVPRLARARCVREAAALMLYYTRGLAARRR